MKANFHTHTARCHHAEGIDREYVESAIEAGLTSLGFSDHAPYFFPDDYYSNFRMRPGAETDDYVRSVLSLREKYKRDITIYLGFEAEYYPLYFDRFLSMIEGYPYDYLILGQHFVRNEIGMSHLTNKFRDPTILTDYVNESIEGLRTGRFFYMAHPDLPFFKGDSAFYASEMRRLCEAAKALSVPLEINLLGLRTKRNYPCSAFWRIAGEVGNDVLLGCDAHSPDSLALPDDLAAAGELVSAYGLHLTEPTAPFCAQSAHGD